MSDSKTLPTLHALNGARMSFEEDTGGRVIHLTSTRGHSLGAFRPNPRVHGLQVFAALDTLVKALQEENQQDSTETYLSQIDNAVKDIKAAAEAN